MTQADLPQLSLRRYVDLVKRRRWQVVPISLLGLLIGGLVAFFIPRLFVAETLLIHQQLPEGPADKEKPFRAIVDSAKSSIPVSVMDAIDALNWPEVKALEPFYQEQFYRDCESRVKVTELSGSDKTRTYVTMRVQYKDRDGARSADLLNKLVEVWIARRTQDLREPAQELRKDAKDKAESAHLTLQRYRTELQQIRQGYGIDPRYDVRDQQQDFKRLMVEQGVRTLDQEKRRIDQSKLTARIQVAEEDLGGTAPKIDPPAGFILAEALKYDETKALVASAMHALIAYTKTLNPGTREWFKWKRIYETQLVLIKQLMPQVPVDKDGKVENPDYKVLREQLEEDRAALAELDAAITATEKKIEEESAALLRLDDGYSLFSAKQQEFKEAEAAREAAVTELREAYARLAQLQQDIPVRQSRKALIPPVPTEPNIMIVALAGSALGLFAAIALILLFDMLQGSYKTVEDVERGLGVPVLGGVSHLETEEERVATTRSRRRASLLAAAALLLVTAVVSIFYIDPTRLPPAVRSILTIILGA